MSRVWPYNYRPQPKRRRQTSRVWPYVHWTWSFLFGRMYRLHPGADR